MDPRRHSQDTSQGHNPGQQPGRAYQQNPYDPYYQQQQHVRPEDIFRQPQYTYSSSNMVSGSYATTRNTTPPDIRDSAYTQCNQYPSPSRHAIHPESQTPSQSHSRRTTPPDGINSRHSAYGDGSGTVTPRKASSSGNTPPGKGKERQRDSDEDVRRRLEAERKASISSGATLGGGRHGPEPDPKSRRGGRDSAKLVSGVFIRY